MIQEHFKNILTRGLPKTGQSTSYSVWDDGYFHSGWWLRRNYTNNRTRFVAKTISGDDIVIDRATGLMWVANQQSKGCNYGNTINWEDALAYADGEGALNFAGFGDWYIPNVKQLFSIVDFGRYDPALDTDFFTGLYGDNVWASTTRKYPPTTFAWYVAFDQGQVWTANKEDGHYIRPVRGGR